MCLVKQMLERSGTNRDENLKEKNIVKMQTLKGQLKMAIKRDA